MIVASWLDFVTAPKAILRPFSKLQKEIVCRWLSLKYTELHAGNLFFWKLAKSEENVYSSDRMLSITF